MQDRVTIRTPDHVELEFELAGVGSRLAAGLIDGLLLLAAIIGAWIIVVLGSAAAAAYFSFSTSSLASPTWIIALGILVVFLITWGYFLFFERLMGGRTPGKKVLGIRVIRDNGAPIGLKEAVLRNLVRVADLIPPPFPVLGGFMMLLHPQGKRLGDLLAGTLVIREEFVTATRGGSEGLWGAAWVARLEKGESRKPLVLPRGTISTQQLGLIEQFMARRHSLPAVQRHKLAWQIARPMLALLDIDPTELEKQPDRAQQCEQFLSQILEKAQGARHPSSSTPSATAPEAASAGAEKMQLWSRFTSRAQTLLKQGKRALRRLSTHDLDQLMEEYRRITGDLARARSMGADVSTVARLNRMAVAGYSLLYGHRKSETAPRSRDWIFSFAEATRRHPAAVLLSAVLLFGPGAVSYVAVQWHPELGYEIVPDDFLEFEPSREESLHDIPNLARPMVASAIVTNNIQVTLLTFGLGLTAGIGTLMILIFNGVHIGAVAGWMTAGGHGRALWGWIMPHGGTELLAIVLSGAAGLILARALLTPGEVSRSTALRRVGMDALKIELGCMALLIVAGLIEGFVSPSHISYAARIAVLAGSLTLCLLYLAFAGRG